MTTTAAGTKTSAAPMNRAVLYCWLVGMAIVALSFLWQGCLHFTCVGGVNGEASFRSKRSSGATTFLGMHESSASCEQACISAQSKKGCGSFTYFTSGAFSNQCFATVGAGWSNKADPSAVSGRPYLLTSYSVSTAAHPFAVSMQVKFAALAEAVEAWPIAVKLKELAAHIPPRPEVSSRAWLLLSVTLLFWPAVLALFTSSTSTSEETPVAASSTAPPSSLSSASVPQPNVEKASPHDAQDAERIPLLSEVVDLGANVGRSLQEGIKGLEGGIKGITEGVQRLIPQPEEEEGEVEPAAN